VRNRTLKVTAVAGVLAVAVVPTGTSFADSATAPSAAVQADSFLGGRTTVPEKLVPPAGNVLTSVFKAHGVQIYGCTNGAWTLTEPAASLAGIALNPVRPASAIHFRGPSWESDQDGTLIEGMSPVSAPSDNPNSIPQLLITAKLTRGTGVFGGVTFVQRLATKGGVAPSSGCAAGDVKAVQYTAVYRFFKKG